MEVEDGCVSYFGDPINYLKKDSTLWKLVN